MHRVARFLETYSFIAKDNLQITDHMKLMIAGTHVKLTFGIKHYLIKVFDKIILYPVAYYSNTNNAWHKGEFNPRMKAIVFSWEDFYKGFQYENDNLHLGYHEFAHALHFHGLKSKDDSALIFMDGYQKIKAHVLQPRVMRNLKNSNYFRDYAYTDSFEFIAVLLEHFFETPQQLKNEFPALYKMVQNMINFRYF